MFHLASVPPVFRRSLARPPSLLGFPPSPLLLAGTGLGTVRVAGGIGIRLAGRGVVVRVTVCVIMSAVVGVAMSLLTLLPAKECEMVAKQHVQQCIVDQSCNSLDLPVKLPKENDLR